MKQIIRKSLALSIAAIMALSSVPMGFSSEVIIPQQSSDVTKAIETQTSASWQENASGQSQDESKKDSTEQKDNKTPDEKGGGSSDANTNPSKGVKTASNQIEDQKTDETEAVNGQGLSEIIKPVAIARSLMLTSVLEKEVQVNFSNAGTGDVLVYVNHVYAGYKEGAFGAGTVLDKKVPVGTVIDAFAIPKGNVYNYAAWNVLVHNENPTLNINTATTGSLFHHEVRATDVSINVSPTVLSGTPSDALAVTVKTGKGGDVEGYRGRIEDNLKFGTVASNQERTITLISELPIALKAIPNTGVKFKGWANRNREIISTDLVFVTKVSATNNYFEAVYESEYEKNFEADKLNNPTIDAFKRGFLNAKAFEIRDITLKNNPSNFYPVKGKDISGMYGVERSKSVLLSPIENYNGTTIGTFPWNTVADGSQENGKLYWGENNYNENSHNQVIDFWGYFVPERTGYYKVGVNADDGAKGWITVDGTEKPIADEYTYHMPKICAVGSDEGSEEMLLQAGKIYPIKINYFENNVTGTVFSLSMKYRASTETSLSNWASIPGTYLYPDTDLHKHFKAAPINFEKPEATVGNFDLTNGTAEKNTHLVVKLVKGTDVVEKSVTVSDEGKWSLEFSAEDLKIFEDGAIQIIAEYKDVTGDKKEATINYTYAYDFVLTADNRYELYVDGVRVQDSRIVGPNKSGQYGWDYAKRYLLNLNPNSKHVIAVKGIDEGIIGGIKSELTFNGKSIASGDSNNWKHFEGAVSPEWFGTKFNDSGWTAPTVQSDSRWSTLKNFPSTSNAQWIWAPNNTEAKTVYFRLTVGQQPTYVDIKGKTSLTVPLKGQPVVAEDYVATVLDQDGVPMAFDPSKIMVRASVDRADYTSGAKGQISLSPASVKGKFDVTASYNGTPLPTVNTKPYTVTINKADPVATTIAVEGKQSLNVPTVHEAIVNETYLGVVYDQYGFKMNNINPENVKVVFTDLPNEVVGNHENGLVTLRPNSSAGQFTVSATLTVPATGSSKSKEIKSDDASPFVVVVNKAAATADLVTISGMQKITLPTYSANPLTMIGYTATVRNQYGQAMSLDAPLEIVNVQDFEGVSINKLMIGNAIRVSQYPKTKTGTLQLKVKGIDATVSGNGYSVVLKKARSYPKLLTLTSDWDDNNPLTDNITIPSTGVKQTTYTAKVMDQYNEVMGVKPSLELDKAFAGFVNGVLTVDRSTNPTTFNVVAKYGELKSATIAVVLQKEKLVPRVAFVDQGGRVYAKASDVIEIPVKDAVSRTYKAVVFDQYDDLTNLVPEVTVKGLGETTQGITWDAKTNMLKVTSGTKPLAGETGVVIEGKYDSSTAQMKVAINYAAPIPSLDVMGKEVITIPASGTADEVYTYRITDQYSRDITKTSEIPVKLEAYLLVKKGDVVERKALPAGMTFDSVGSRLKADATLAVGNYDVAVDGYFSERLDAPFTKIPDTLVVKVTKSALVVPPTPQPQPQVETRGERGDRATFANVIIADELTPLGAVKFNNAYMVGYPNKTFRPNAIMTRGEAAAVFANVLGLNKNLKSGIKFTDVSTGDWHYGAIQASVKLGLLSAKDGKFNPNEPVTRADMAAAFSKFWELNNIKVSDAATKTTDIAGHWAEKQINQTINAKLLAAFDDNTFKPDSAVTREQTAVMFNKLIARAKIAKTKPTFKDVSLDYWAAGDIEAAVMKMNLLGK